MSFNENNLNNLEVHSENNIEELDNSDLLTYKVMIMNYISTDYLL